DWDAHIERATKGAGPSGDAHSLRAWSLFGSGRGPQGENAEGPCLRPDADRSNLRSRKRGQRPRQHSHAVVCRHPDGRRQRPSALCLPIRRAEASLLAGLAGLAILATAASAVANVPLFDRFANADVATFNGRTHTHLWSVLLNPFNPGQLSCNGL